MDSKIAMFDLDGTLIDTHLWSGIVKYHLRKREKLASVFWYLGSHLALLPFWKMRLISTEKYYKGWGQDLATMIKGVKADKAKEIFTWLSDEYLLPTLKKNVLERLKKHQQDGFLTIITSGSFQNLIDIIAERLNINFAVGTELEIDSDKFSGRIVPPFCFSQGKAAKVKNFLAKKNLKIDFKESFAYSDSFFDLPTLEMVGNPVAVEPDKKLLEIAKVRGWQII